MSSAVNITVTLNEDAAVQGVTKLKSALAGVAPAAADTGAKATAAFAGIENAETRAHLAGMLFARTTGVEIPRALETVIARSQTLGPLLAGLFSVSVAGAGIGAAITAFGALKEKIESAMASAAGYDDQVKQIYAETVKASQQAFVNPQTIASARTNIAQLMQQQHNLNSNDLKDIEARTNAYVQQHSIVSQVLGISTIIGETEAIFGRRLGESLSIQEKQRQSAIALTALLEKQAQIQRQQAQELTQTLGKQNEVGLQGYALAAQQLQNSRNSILAGADPKNPVQTLEQLKNAQATYQNQVMQLRRANAQETMNLRHQVDEDALQGIARVQQTETDELETLDSKHKHSLIDETDYQQQRVYIAFAAAQKKMQIENEGEKYVADLETKARDAGLSANQKIVADKQNALFTIAQMYGKGLLNDQEYARAVVAINKAADEETIRDARQTQQEMAATMQEIADKTKAAQEEAALAAVPEWRQATAQLQIELTKRLEMVQQSYDQQYKAFEERKLKEPELTAQIDADEVLLTQRASDQRLAIEQALALKIRDANVKMADQLGQEMETVFNDMGSGKLGTDILNAVKKLFFQILAEWILTVTQMGSVFQQLFGALTGNTSSLFGAGGMLSGLFGGSSAIPGAATSGGGGLLSTLFGNSSGSPSSSTAGITGALASSGALSMVAPGALTAGTTAASLIAGTAGTGAGALTSSSIGAAMTGAGGLGAAGAATLAAPTLAGRLGSLASMSTLTAMSPLLLTLLGSQFGGTIGQAGGMLGSLGILAAMNPGMLGTLGMYLPGIGAVLGGGLLGFGVGMQQGPVLGALAGAGAGVGMGALLLSMGLSGGPIGLAIAGIVGLLGGIFGGLFGGSKRRKQANNYFTQQIDPAVQKIVSDYEGHTLDYSSATAQLEQLRTQAQAQLDKLKGEGKSVFKDKVAPDIDAAEKKIGMDEAERTRRAGLVFGPPQFHGGGFVSAMAQSYTAKPGELLALLKHGEFVVNPQATSRNRGALESLNSGGRLPASGPSPTIQIVAWDGASVDRWLRTGGAKMLSDGLDRLWNKEGGS